MWAQVELGAGHAGQPRMGTAAGEGRAPGPGPPMPTSHPWGRQGAAGVPVRPAEGTALAVNMHGERCPAALTSVRTDVQAPSRSGLPAGLSPGAVGMDATSPRLASGARGLFQAPPSPQESELAQSRALQGPDFGCPAAPARRCQGHTQGCQRRPPGCCAPCGWSCPSLQERPLEQWTPC